MTLFDHYLYTLEHVFPINGKNSLDSEVHLAPLPSMYLSVVAPVVAAAAAAVAVAVPAVAVVINRCSESLPPPAVTPPISRSCYCCCCCCCCCCRLISWQFHSSWISLAYINMGNTLACIFWEKNQLQHYSTSMKTEFPLPLPPTKKQIIISFFPSSSSSSSSSSPPPPHFPDVAANKLSATHHPPFSSARPTGGRQELPCNFEQRFKFARCVTLTWRGVLSELHSTRLAAFGCGLCQMATLLWRRERKRERLLFLNLLWLFGCKTCQMATLLWRRKGEKERLLFLPRLWLFGCGMCRMATLLWRREGEREERLLPPPLSLG